MVKPVKSILLVDLDGLGRSLAASGGEKTDARLAERIADWSGAIESGELIAPGGTRHGIAQRRCYVGSAGRAAARAAFERAGFDIVECDGQAQVELSLAVDAMDAAADADDDLVFILLTAAPDLTPLVERLQGRGHRVAVYVSNVTAADYRDAADMTIPADELVALLAEGTAPAPAAAPMSAAERDRIEAFAREVHTATNIPMFSPKTFAELFRALAAEVTEHGYHFNDTAKSVAEHLASAGRNVTSRQVVFVVKGLALKGHVFSTDDTAERLAEVFREQARYLIAGAGITLDAKREALLNAWIAAPTAAAAAAAKPARAAEPAAERKPVHKPPPARRPDKPAKPSSPPSPPRLPERPKSAALAAKAAPPPEPAKPAKSNDLRATIAARIAASAKMKPATRPPPRTDTAEEPPRKPPAEAPAEPEDTIESSILAAIAEAVDVLVEDGSDDAAETRPASRDREARQPAARRAPSKQPPAEEPPPADDEPEEDSGDIGDEIQRIVATYNRNRDDGQRS